VNQRLKRIIRRHKLSTMTEIVLEELQHSPTSFQDPVDPMNKNTWNNDSQKFRTGGPDSIQHGSGVDSARDSCG
jgi:hypothetical protein